jgi:hypothetical protein
LRRKGWGSLVSFLFVFGFSRFFLLRINRFSKHLSLTKKEDTFSSAAKIYEKIFTKLQKKLFDAPKLFSYVTFYFLKHNHLLPGAYPTKSYKYWFTNICNILHFCYF